MKSEEVKMQIFTDDGFHHRQQRPRSEARIKYYKPAGHSARRSPGSAKEKRSKSSFKERIIFQATICGGFLALLLFFNIVDSGPTNTVTGWVNRNLSYDMLAEHGGFVPWVNSLLAIFNNSEPDDTEYRQVYSPQATENPPITPDNPDISRIDENILREINSMVDVYYENNR